MSNLLRFALVFLPLAACVSPAVDDGADTDVDDAVSDIDAKSDQVQALKHYVLYAREGRTYVVRANGGTMRCQDNTLAELCRIDDAGLVVPGGLGGSSEVMIDELEDQPLMITGRIVRDTVSKRVFIRVATSTFAITSVVPSIGPDHPETSIPATCFQMQAQPNVDIKYTRLDGTKVTTAKVTEYGDVDPTPDPYGEPTAAVQAQIDKAVVASKTRTVYTCGFVELRTDVHQWWFSADQIFVNL